MRGMARDKTAADTLNVSHAAYLSASGTGRSEVTAKASALDAPRRRFQPARAGSERLTTPGSSNVEIAHVTAVVEAVAVAVIGEV
jgi:hypothetical protein